MTVTVGIRKMHRMARTAYKHDSASLDGTTILNGVKLSLDKEEGAVAGGEASAEHPG